MPQKNKVIRGNHKPHITNELKKQISIRSKLRKLANTTGSEEDIAKYKRQRNFVSLINNKAKNDYFRTLDPKKHEMNRKFFTTFKPFLSSKYSPDERILLIEDNEIISDDSNISEIMNDYFTNITDSMNIKQWPEPDATDEFENDIDRAVNKYRNHPSILKIHSVYGDQYNKFEFLHSTTDNVDSEISKLDSSKSSSGPLSTKILKETSFIYKHYFTDCINSSIDECKFPNKL